MKRAATLFLFLACLVCVAHARPSVVPEISSPITSMKASGLVDASLDGASPTARTIGLPLSRREVHNKKVNTCTTYAHKRYDAADATLEGGATVRNDDDHGDFTGNGYVNLMADTGDSITWTIPYGSVCSNTVALKFRYAGPAIEDGGRWPLKLEVDGKIVEDSLSFRTTGTWQKWRFVTVHTQLLCAQDVPGTCSDNKVKLTTIGSSGANFDKLVVVATIGPKDYFNNEDNTANTCTTYAHKRYDAADATLEGEATVRNDDDHGHFTGKGYVNLMADTGDSITWTIPEGSVCSTRVTLKFRYALLDDDDMPLKLEVDGNIEEDSLSFPKTGSWQKWRFVEVHNILLQNGDNKVKLTTIGSSGANFDRLVVVAPIGPTDYFDNEDNTANTCKSYAHKRYDAADAKLKGAATKHNDNEHGHFTGNGYVNLVADTGDSITWTIPHGSVCSHTVALKFRYALLDDDDRPLKLEVNDEIVTESLSFPKTGSRKTWDFVTVLDVVLRRGKNKVKLTTIGSSGASFDRLAVVATIAPTAAQLVDMTNERDAAWKQRDSAQTKLLACENDKQNEKAVCDAALKSCKDGIDSAVQGAVQGCMTEKAVCQNEKAVCQNEKTACDAALQSCQDGIDSAVQKCQDDCDAALQSCQQSCQDDIDSAVLNAVQQCQDDCQQCDNDLGMCQGDKEYAENRLKVCDDALASCS